MIAGEKFDLPVRGLFYGIGHKPNSGDKWFHEDMVTSGKSSDVLVHRFLG